MSAAPRAGRRPGPGPFVPELARDLTGHCRVAQELEHDRGPGAGDAFHARCHGAYLLPLGRVRRCACLCHEGDEEPVDTDGQIRAARLERELARMPPERRRPPELEGVPGPPAQPGIRRREACAHGHPMTPENTGPRGVCRACKREASRRAKAKRQP